MRAFLVMLGIATCCCLACSGNHLCAADAGQGDVNHPDVAADANTDRALADTNNSGDTDAPPDVAVADGPSSADQGGADTALADSSTGIPDRYAACSADASLLPCGGYSTGNNCLDTCLYDSCCLQLSYCYLDQTCNLWLHHLSTGTNQRTADVQYCALNSCGVTLPL